MTSELGSEPDARIDAGEAPEANAREGEETVPDDAKGVSDELARQYDRQYESGGFRYDERRETWTKWVQDHYVREFGMRPGERLLDVGCGDGFWTGLFAEGGLTATGVDLSPKGIEIARRNHPSARFVVGDAEDLPFPDESFDIVFCRAISHLSRPDLFTDASARLMSSMARMLVPGGIMLISFSSRRDGGGTPSHTWHRLSDLIRLIEPVADPHHVDVVGNYVQIGAQRWDAPRVRSRASASDDRSPWTGLTATVRRAARGVRR